MKRFLIVSILSIIIIGCSGKKIAVDKADSAAGSNQLQLQGPSVLASEVTNFECHYDNTIDSSVTGSDLCDDIIGVSFNTVTGELSWDLNFKNPGDFELEILANLNNSTTNSVIHSVSIGSSNTNSSVNSSPTIDSPSTQQAIENGSTVDIPIIVGDDNSTLDCSTSLSATSSNTTLVNNSNITFSGAAPNCIAHIDSQANQTGSSVVTIAVNDGASQSTVDIDFIVQVPVTVSITSSTGGATTTTPIPFQVTFSEVVDGFSSEDLNISLGTISNFINVDNQTYTFDVTPPSVGSVVVGVDESIASAQSNSAGNAQASDLSVSYSLTPPCAGTMYAGYCWHHDDNNASCDAICSDNGGYHLATRYITGSHGSQQACDDVLRAIAHPENNYRTVGDFGSFGDTFGCATGNTDWESFGTAPTLSSVPAGGFGSRRVCACNDGSAAVGAPNEVINLTATSGSTTDVLLQWANGGGATNDFLIAYAVGLTAPADCSAAQVGADTIEYVTESAIKYLVTGLSANTQYSFRVCATNALASPTLSAGLTASASTEAVNAGLVASRAIYEGSSSNNFTVDALTHSYNHTVTSSTTDNMLVVIVRNYNYGGNLDVSSINANAKAMTRLIDVELSLDWGDYELWYVLDPDLGVNTITMTTANNNKPFVVAANFSNVNQALPFGTPDTDNSTPIDSHVFYKQISSSQDKLIMGISSGYSANGSAKSTSGYQNVNYSSASGKYMDVSLIGGEANSFYAIDLGYDRFGISTIEINGN